MSFYLKYRPTNFEEMLGNTGTIASLQATLDKEDRPHVYLFVGETGCGKTTAARICINKLGIHPSVIHEVNSANNRGIETARQIIEQLHYTPLQGSAVAYIIDEVHQTTKDWQNAMLKVLEDTPAHMYFFLCTTDDSKLIKALLSRCTKFVFEPLRKGDATTLVNTVTQSEGITLPEKVMIKLLEVSEGRPRELLTNLERVANLETDDALRALDIGADSIQVIELCRALIRGESWSYLASTIKGLDTNDAEAIRRAVLGYAKAVMLNGSPDAAKIIEAFREPMYDIGMPGVVYAAWKCAVRQEPVRETKQIKPVIRKKTDF